MEIKRKTTPVNLEDFSVVWLDAKMFTTGDCEDTSDYKTFDKSDQCTDYIASLTECRLSYDGNNIEKEKIHDFKYNYKLSDAIRWYKCDSFVYRLLNQAL
ncbi:unnamed protein product [Rotaria magnacalcarata]|nr:unnamed protein product [Rotaria magnacalcarata]CAF3942409.1 unnamed protein product [Rotaria magnacalcarata]